MIDITSNYDSTLLLLLLLFIRLLFMDYTALSNAHERKNIDVRTFILTFGVLDHDRTSKNSRISTLAYTWSHFPIGHVQPSAKLHRETDDAW
jgi:hypothetical protein